MMQLLVNGVPYSDWLTASATVSLRTLANDFKFTASAVGKVPAPKLGDRVGVLIDGVLKVTGYVEEINGDEAEGLHTVVYSGRDKTGDLIDATLDVVPDIRPSDSLTLKRLIEIILDHLGLDISVVDKLRPLPFNAAEDIISPRPGQGALGFLLTYARKRQAILTSDGEGRIVITQSEPVDSGAVVQSINDADSNNILAQNWSLKGSQKFNRYVRRGQLDPRALNIAGDISSDSVSDQNGEVIDPSIRKGRQQVVVENEAYSSGQLIDRAKWAKQQAEAAATTYGCTVEGHRNSSGDIWETNTLAQVHSEAADISRKMLLELITFSEGEGAPTTSQLEFVERNVYTINEKILSQRPAGNQNDAFKSLG